MSDALGTDERLHRAALGTLLGPVVNGQLYDYGEAPGDPNNPDKDARALPLPEIFVLLGIERRGGIEAKNACRTARSGWRISLRYVGRTVDDARWAASKCAAALDGTRLVIDGVTSTPVTHESTQAIAPDDGRFSGVEFYTYAL